MSILLLSTFGQTCQCWPGWTDQFCRTCCDMPCDESRGGVCYVYTPDDSMRCRCYNKNYTGTYCNETVFVNDTLSAETESTQIILLDVTPLPSSGLLPQPILPWQVALIALGGVLAILMIITVLLLTYFRRRKSLLWKKLVYRFSSYEDDYTRKYDAFVSYRGHGEDLQFVRYKLMEKLEKEMNFKLCLDYREFVGGKCIAENILHAIQKSRRTILVISPNYAEGEWPRFEYQAAQKEMLGMRHRIIPILFKDVSKVNKLDVNLRYIMDKITYIEWPGEEDEAALSRFWEQLRLSMPKKKQSDVTQVSHA